MTHVHPGFDQRIRIDGSPLLGPRRKWHRDARSAFDDLLGRLDLWALAHGLANAHNPAIAEAAVREVWGGTRWRTLDPPLRPSQTAAAVLPHELRCWPAVWRYRVAALERQGMARAAAIEQARTEVQDSPCDAVSLCA